MSINVSVFKFCCIPSASGHRGLGLTSSGLSGSLPAGRDLRSRGAHLTKEAVSKWLYVLPCQNAGVGVAKGLWVRYIKCLKYCDAVIHLSCKITYKSVLQYNPRIGKSFFRSLHAAKTKEPPSRNTGLINVETKAISHSSPGQC